MVVSIYRERFGVIPPSHDTKQPSIKIPTDIIIPDIDKNIIKYWRDMPLAAEYLHDELAKVNARLDLRHTSETELRVICTVSQGDIEARTRAKGWTVRVKQCVNNLLGELQVKERSCLEKIWKAICDTIRVQKIKQISGTVAVMERADKSTIYVIGPASSIDAVYKQVEQICTDLEQTLEHIKITVEAKDIEKAIFEKANFVEKLRKKHLKLEVLMKPDGIELQGAARDLVDAQSEIHNFFKKMHKRTLNMSQGKWKVVKLLLQQPQSHFYHSINQLTSVVYIDQDDVVVIGFENDVKLCVDILSNEIKEVTNKISDVEQVALRDEVWKPFSKHLQDLCRGILHLERKNDNSTINIVAYGSDFDTALELLKEHIKKNTIKDIIVETDPLTIKFMKRHMKQNVEMIEKKLETQSLKIHLVDDTGFQISGVEEGVLAAKQEVEKLTGQVHRDRHTVTSQGMTSYFTTEEMGQMFIKHQEETHRVLIHHTDSTKAKEHEEDQTEGKEKNVLEQPGSRETSMPTKSLSTIPLKELEEVSHPCGVKVKSLIGDMPTHQVDVIVNAANDKLRHIGGLARAIVDQGVYERFVLLFF